MDEPRMNEETLLAIALALAETNTDRSEFEHAFFGVWLNMNEIDRNQASMIALRVFANTVWNMHKEGHQE